MYMAPLEEARDPSKLINFKICDPVWVREALGNILTSIVSKLSLGKQPGPGI